LQHAVACTEYATIACMAQPVYASRTHVKLATPVSVVTFAYSDVIDDDEFDATRSPTASDKVPLIN